MYEIGRVYIWQNQVGVMGHINGTECTLTGSSMRYRSVLDGQWRDGWPTDTLAPPGLTAFAEPGDLRPRDTPSGERRVLDLFREPAHE